MQANRTRSTPLTSGTLKHHTTDSLRSVSTMELNRCCTQPAVMKAQTTRVRATSLSEAAVYLPTEKKPACRSVADSRRMREQTTALLGSSRRGV